MATSGLTQVIHTHTHTHTQRHRVVLISLTYSIDTGSIWGLCLSLGLAWQAALSWSLPATFSRSLRLFRYWYFWLFVPQSWQVTARETRQGLLSLFLYFSVPLSLSSINLDLSHWWWSLNLRNDVKIVIGFFIFWTTSNNVSSIFCACQRWYSSFFGKKRSFMLSATVEGWGKSLDQ